MSIPIFNIINSVIAGTALVFSIASFSLYFKEQKNSRFNLKMEFDSSDSFYFNALEMANGNKESLIVSVRIKNDSNQPICISDIQLFFSEQSVLSAPNISEYPYPESLPDETFATIKDENGLLVIKSIYGDGIKYINLSKNLIKCPLYLNAYDSVKGFILFPLAGSSRHQTTIRLVTARGNANFTFPITTKSNHEKSFEYKNY